MTSERDLLATTLERDAVVCTESWAGRHETRVKVLMQQSTPKRYLESAVRRRGGEVVLVPKYAVHFTDGAPPPEELGRKPWSPAANGGGEAARGDAGSRFKRATHCPVCHHPYLEGACVNPACWVDSNPKRRV